MQPGAKGERRAADLPRKFKLRHYPALDQLAVVPLSLRNQIKRLKGQTGLRLRVGDWRIIFELRSDEILILMIAHRSEAYR
jgi:mRNA-degrading endonuclease RelE of RelBE toxin-antitoxin system